MTPLLAVVLSLLFAIGGYSLMHIAIFVVVAIVVLAIVVIVARNAGIPIPPWVWQIFGLVLLCIVAVVAIKFLFSL